jgi:hypothetical protein
MGSETGSMKSLERSWHHQYYTMNAILGEFRVTTKLKPTLKPMEISIHSLQDRECTWQAEEFTHKKTTFQRSLPDSSVYKLQCCNP